MLRRLAAVAFAPVMAFALLTSLPAPSARADDLTQCIAGWAKSALNPDEIAEALEFLASYGQCIPLIADPSGQFAAITAALVAAKKAGQFSSVNQCQQMIPGLIGDVVLKVGDAVGDVVGFKVPDHVKSKGKDYITQWVLQEANKNPVIASIMAEMNCGCAVATYGSDKFEKVINQVVDTVEACAGLLGDIAALGAEIANKIADGLEDAAKDLKEISHAALDLLEDCLSASAGQKSVMDCLEEFPEVAKALAGLITGAAGKAVDAFLDAMGGFLSWSKAACCGTVGHFWGGFCGGCSKPSKPTPPKIDLSCQGLLCSKGQQCGGELNDRCVPCSEGGGIVAYGEAKNKCNCTAGFTPQYKATKGGPVLTACQCNAPKVIKHALLFAACTCPIKGQVVKYREKEEKDLSPAEKAVQHVAKAAKIPFAGGKQTKETISLGKIAYCDCPWGESLQGGECKPIQCPPKQSIMTDGKSCTEIIHFSDQPSPSTVTTPAIPPCPLNYHWDGAKCVYGAPTAIQGPLVPVKPVPRTPACPANFRWDGTRCIPPGAATGPAKPGTARTTPAVPRCPANTVWDGARCAPVPAIRAKPKIPTCPANARWDGKRCAPVPATTAVPRTVTPRTVVPSCPPNTKWDGRGCAPAIAIQRPPAVFAPAPAIRRAPPATRRAPAIPQCPTGTHWDGQRCASARQRSVPPAMPAPSRQFAPQIVR